MSNNGNRNEALIKFVAPIELKESLLYLAQERNIALSSLLRLIASEYVKCNRTTGSSQLPIKWGWQNIPRATGTGPFPAAFVVGLIYCANEHRVRG